MIADDHHLLAQGEGGEPQYIALARFIDEDHVKVDGAELEAFKCCRERHDPDRHRLVALQERLARFLLELPYQLARAFADFPMKPQPPVQSLLLLQPRSF